MKAQEKNKVDNKHKNTQKKEGGNNFEAFVDNAIAKGLITNRIGYSLRKIEMIKNLK